MKLKTSVRVAGASLAGVLALAGAVPVLAPEVGSDGASLVATASAHDVVLSSNPANGEVVSVFPSEIVFEFSGLVQDDFNTIAITEKVTGEVVFEGEPTIDGQMVSIEVPAGTAGGAGDYTIGYQITSSDGHPTRGGVEFTYAPKGAEEATSADAAAATSAATGADTQVSTQASNGENGSAATTEAEASDAENEAEEENSSSSMLLILLIIAAVVVGSVVATTKRKKNNNEA